MSRARADRSTGPGDPFPRTLQRRVPVPGRARGRSNLRIGRIAGGLLALAASGGCAAAGSSASAESHTVTVAAGDFDRRATPVAFELPPGLPAGPYHLRSAGGDVVPLQVGADGRAHFIVEALPSGTVAEFALVGGAAEEPGVRLDRDDGTLTFHVGGRPVLTYQAEVTDPPRPDIDPVYARGGYIHPLLSPAGVVVTGDYPPDHVHHHGIWASWTRTRFRGEEVDFWNVADREGDVVPLGVDTAWSGEVHGGFSARHRYVALIGDAPTDALHERWTVRVFDVDGDPSPYWLFDLEVEQATASASPLELPTYHYGGVAFRGRDDWYGAANATFLTSDGHDRRSGNETRARWTHIGGTAEGGARGVAVLSHPDNFRHPEPVRIHPTEPYFVWTPSQLGDWSIEPGAPHRVRYRYVVHDGAPDAGELDRIWDDFAHPPVVTVSAR